MRLTEAEWSVLSVLWRGERFALGEVTEALREEKKWSRNTVHTYLTRMEAKGMVSYIREGYPRRYQAALSREECLSKERNRFLDQVYKGSTKDLIAAFLQEKPITEQERDELRRLLDEMEV